jgi:tetratricopeptide (TPR) repeat protein
MKPISSFAIAAALVAGGAFLTAPVQEASAKTKKAEEPAPGAAAQRKLNLTKAAQPALKALETAVKNKDNAAYPAALAAAQTAATNDDEKYFVMRQRYAHARDVNDAAEQLAALEALVASPSATPPEVSSSYFNIGIASFNASNWQKANDSFAKVIEISPTDSDAMFNLALAQTKLHKDAEALATLQRAIAAKKTASQAVPEPWYRQALQLAYSAHKPEATALARETLAAYPTQENWRNALVVYRDGMRRDNESSLDVLRLMRASKSLGVKSEYYDLALALADAGLPGEAEQVLREVSTATLPSPARPTDDTYRRVQAFVTGKIAEDKASLPGLETRAASAATGRLAFRTADAFLGYGDYAKAAALYRAALAKGGADVDAGLVNTHLGMALALSGDKAGAEAAFKAVTGPRAEVAQLWLAWLARR